jgi:Tfp pilus assembly protein PilF
MKILKEYLTSKETRKYTYIILALIIVLVFALYLRARNNRIFRSNQISESAIVMMETGDFQAAISALKHSLSINRGNAQAHYALAVALMRQKQPDIKEALKHRNIAQRLGYVIPTWFDNYVKMLSKK